MILKELKIDTWIGDPTNCYIILDEKYAVMDSVDARFKDEWLENIIKETGAMPAPVFMFHPSGPAVSDNVS